MTSYEANSRRAIKELRRILILRNVLLPETGNTEEQELRRTCLARVGGEGRHSATRLTEGRAGSRGIEHD